MKLNRTSLSERTYDVLEALVDGCLSMHGRTLYNAFGLHFEELKASLKQLYKLKLIDKDLAPLPTGLCTFPGIGPASLLRLKDMWDAFIFTYMSHKIQNIQFRQNKRSVHPRHLLLYLRSADYNLSLRSGGAGLGVGTFDDLYFSHRVRTLESNEFHLVKSLSQSDLNIAIKDIAQVRSQIGYVEPMQIVEFAREYGGGLFFSTRNWVTAIKEIIAYCSGIIVYFNNYSRSLRDEIQFIHDKGLQDKTIIVVEEDRRKRRQAFLEKQADLIAKGFQVYEQNQGNICNDAEADQLDAMLESFPVKLYRSKDQTVEQIIERIRAELPSLVSGHPQSPPEIGFHFLPALTAHQFEHSQLVRSEIDALIERVEACELAADHPSVCFLYQVSGFLELCHGNSVRASERLASLSGTYAYLREVIVTNKIDDLRQVALDYQKATSILEDISLTSLGSGRWDDYSDRRQISTSIYESIFTRAWTQAIERSVQFSELGFLSPPNPRPSDTGERHALLRQYRAVFGDEESAVFLDHTTGTPIDLMRD